MQTLPLFAKLEHRRTVVVGGGTVATRRVEQLLRAKAQVVVVAPEIDPLLVDWAASDRIETIEAPFSAEQLDGCWIAVAATSDDAVNRAVAEAAEARQILCNVVDQPELCSFIMPAIIDRDPMTIAISSNGRSPVLARWIKGLIEQTVPQRIGALAALAGRWRDRVKAALPDLDERRRFWEQTLTGDVADFSYAGRDDDAEEALDAALERWLGREAAGTRHTGQAYLVGAGPGDPELLTLRGRKLLARADTVLYDRLVNPEILDFARRDAELICVGKSAGRLSIKQAQINRLLVNLVGKGKHVCRLKGGDPMIFGRVGEELEALTAAGLPFQIVPGVSAVEGCAAYAGIPLTLRDEAQAVLIATGHTSDHDAGDLSAFRKGQTLALYMGVAHFATIAERLLELGHSGKTPVAIVENGTTREQRIVRTDLRHLDSAGAEHEIVSPALLLIGDTVRYADRYGWFNPRLVRHGLDDDSAQAAS